MVLKIYILTMLKLIEKIQFNQFTYQWKEKEKKEDQ